MIEPTHHRRGFLAGLRASFLTGLVVVLPIGLTIYFVWAVIGWIDGWILPLIPSYYQPDALIRRWIGPDYQFPVRGVGVLVTTHYMQEAQQCDRLLLMSQGRLVAQGTEADIVDGTTAVAVASDDWARVFAVLSAAGLAVNLAGRDVRVIDPDLPVVRELLAGQGIEAACHEVPATIEERMTMLART